MEDATNNGPQSIPSQQLKDFILQSRNRVREIRKGTREGKEIKGTREKLLLNDVV